MRINSHLRANQLLVFRAHPLRVLRELFGLQPITTTAVTILPSLWLVASRLQSDSLRVLRDNQTLARSIGLLHLIIIYAYEPLWRAADPPPPFSKGEQQHPENGSEA